MDLIPVINQNNNLSWYRSSELYFTTKLDIFLKEDLKTHSASLTKIREIHEILENASLKLCAHYQLPSLFLKFGELFLNELTASVIIDKFKQICSSLSEQTIERTIIKN